MGFHYCLQTSVWRNGLWWTLPSPHWSSALPTYSSSGWGQSTCKAESPSSWERPSLSTTLAWSSLTFSYLKRCVHTQDAEAEFCSNQDWHDNTATDKYISLFAPLHWHSGSIALTIMSITTTEMYVVRTIYRHKIRTLFTVKMNYFRHLTAVTLQSPLSYLLKGTAHVYKAAVQFPRGTGDLSHSLFETFLLSLMLTSFLLE